MSSTELRRAALAQSSRARADLAAELLASLDDQSEVQLLSDREWDSAWGDELEIRARRVGAGGITVPASTVFDEARGRRAARPLTAS